MSKATDAIGSVVGSILGTKSGGVTVESEDQTTAPTEDTDAVKAARRRSMIQSQQRSGRSSTILTGSSNNKLGG
uniref:hypothetical protein n=1 Tax=Klebsiella sp. TaxID=576 RepID=UPI0031D0728C